MVTRQANAGRHSLCARVAAAPPRIGLRAVGVMPCCT